MLRDAATQFSPAYAFLTMPNVSRTGLRQSPPSEILDELIKRRMRSGVGVAQTEEHALSGVVDAMLLARTDVLVGKFSSGLFRAAYALASARRAGALVPFVSLDAPWCADYGVPAGHNDAFPKRAEISNVQHRTEQIDPASFPGVAPGGGQMLNSGSNVFLC